MSTLEELEDIFSLAEDDEKFFLKECIRNIRKVHERRPDEDNLTDVDGLQEEYEWYVEEGIPHKEWPKSVLSYEAFAVKGNVFAGGGCYPGNNIGPVVTEAPEDWGIADVYPLVEVEAEDA